MSGIDTNTNANAYDQPDGLAAVEEEEGEVHDDGHRRRRKPKKLTREAVLSVLPGHKHKPIGTIRVHIRVQAALRTFTSKEVVHEMLDKLAAAGVVQRDKKDRWNVWRKAVGAEEKLAAMMKAAAAARSERMSAKMTGRKLSPEHVAKMTGRKRSPETIAKLTGRKLSPEHIAKMTGRKQSPEHIAKRVAARRAATEAKRASKEPE